VSTSLDVYLPPKASGFRLRERGRFLLGVIAAGYGRATDEHQQEQGDKGCLAH
jgi:hypothetical protein